MPDIAPADSVAPAMPQDIPPTLSASALPAVSVGTPPAPPPPQLLPAPIPPVPTAPTTPARPGRRRRRSSRGSSPARRGPRGAAAKRRGRPSNSVFQELEQQYFTQLVVKPIPACKCVLRSAWRKSDMILSQWPETRIFLHIKAFDCYHIQIFLNCKISQS